MLERYNPVFRIVCLVLAALILVQLSRLVRPRGQVFAAFRPGQLEFTSKSAAVETNAVSAEILARVEKIKSSQILGQVITRPPAMPALIGIAGSDVFIRAPNGQTGLVQAGEEFGGVKLLRVGVNRVLIQYEGKTNELTLFEGFGSESLLGKEK
jgi:hypothetical protein